MKRRTFLIIAAVVFATLACSPEFEMLEIEQLSTPPIPTSIVSDHIELTSGTGVIIRVKPVSGNSEPYDNSDNVELESENIDVLRIYKGENFREFGLVGCQHGTTNMRVLINGSRERSIEVTIN